jgi:hypothetical protein
MSTPWRPDPDALDPDELDPDGPESYFTKTPARSYFSKSTPSPRSPVSYFSRSPASSYFSKPAPAPPEADVAPAAPFASPPGVDGLSPTWRPNASFFAAHGIEAQPEPEALPHRVAMERTFGEDFSGVRVQLGGALPDGVHAAAEGEAVTFATASPDPSLVAHELAHVTQARRAGFSSLAFSRAESAPEDAAEQEAEQIAGDVAAHGPDAARVQVRAAPSARVHFARHHGAKHATAAADTTGGDGGHRLHAAPSHLNLTAEVGNSARAPVTLTNPGDQPITIRGVVQEVGKVGDVVRSLGDFRIDGVAAGMVVPAHGAAPLIVTFQPQALLAGDTEHTTRRKATVYVLDKDGNATDRIELDGVAHPHGRMATATAQPTGEATVTGEATETAAGTVCKEGEGLESEAENASYYEAPSRPMTESACIAPEMATTFGDEALREESAAARLAVEGANHDGAIENLNTIEWAAAQRGLALPAPEPGAGILDLKGYSFSSDPVHLRSVLEAVVREHGLKEALNIVVELGYVAHEWDERDAQRPNLATTTAVRNRAGIPALAGRIFSELDAEAKALTHAFEAAGLSEIRRSLDASEATVRGAVAQYGITWNDLFEGLLTPQIASEEAGPVQLLGEVLATILRLVFSEQPKAGAANSNQLHSLSAAARSIQGAQQRTREARNEEDKTLDAMVRDPRYADALSKYLDEFRNEDYVDEADSLAEGKLRDRLMVAGAGDAGVEADLGSPVDPAIAATQAETRGAVEEEDLVTSGLEAQHPILAAFRGDLNAVARGTDDEVAKQVAIKSIETLGNIKKVRSGLDRGKYSVWKLPRIVEATRPKLQVVPGSWRDRALRDHIQEVANDEAWANFAVTVLAVGLSVVAAIPTGGSSVAVGFSVAADVVAVGLDVSIAGEQLQQYEYDRAAAHTDFDPFKAIAEREPGMADVIFSLAAAGLGFASTVHLVRKAKSLAALVRRAVQGDAAAAAAAAELRAALNAEAAQAGAGGALGDEVVIDAVGRSKSTVAESTARGTDGATEGMESTLEGETPAHGLSPGSFGLKTVAEDQQLLDMWNQSMKEAATGENAYTEYLRMLEEGASPGKDEVRAAFDTVNKRFLKKARGVGYQISEVHHWNYPIADNLEQGLDSRHLTPMPDDATHVQVHRETATGHPYRSPVAPENIVVIPDFSTTLKTTTP